MSQTTISRFMFVLLAGFATLTFTEQIESPMVYDCISPIKPIKDLVISSQSPVSLFNGVDNSSASIGIFEGDETSMLKPLNAFHKNAQSYVIVLFYASWCPFSIAFRPNLSVMASLYPSISHFAIEESVVRPSILFKYGVHGFPTLFVLNSTMRVRYHGSRTIDSLMAFYANVTGIKPESVNGTSLGETIHEHEKQNISGPESGSFSWARSPENTFQHETYLTLATIFVVFRLFYLIYPFIMTRARVSWRRRIPNIRIKSLWEHPLLYMNRAIQLFTSLTEPCKRRNLLGAMNTKAKAAWASKSVSFGEVSTSRD